MKHTVLLLVLTLLLAGGVCGYAAADESLENITAVTGPYAGIEEQLSAVALSLNSTAKSMVAGTTEGSGAEILAIAGNLDAAQTALSGTPLASADVQDLIRIKNSLETAGSDLLYSDADKAAVLSTLQTAQTDLTAVKDHLASTLDWAKNDQESFSSDITVLKQGLTDIDNISVSLEEAAVSLTADTQATSVTLEQLETEIGKLVVIRDELISDAVPVTITDDLTAIITGLQTSADSLQSGGDPALISAGITSSATALHAVNSRIAVLPAPETAIPTGTPTETTTVTQTSAPQTLQPTVTETAPTPEVIVPTGTQTTEGDNNPGIIILIVVIICAAGAGAAVFIIKKRGGFGKSQRIKDDPLNIPPSGPADQVPQTQPQVEEEFVEIPAFQKEPIPTPEKTIPTPEPVRTSEPVRSPQPAVTPAEPEKPVTLPSNAGPAEQFKRIASVIAKNRGILQKSEALAPRDLIDKDNPNPLLLEYIALYEKVRYSKRSTPEDTARLTELANRILKENT